ncbi:hypothetical protein C2S51_028998 [Perilla frutescens var. frutescens]|nr:hypothetical protein C2S51_028998 [Perilla frutescens var. frutescens]
MDYTNPLFNKPPVLDGMNYSFWKVRMRSCIKSIDARAWNAVQKTWTHPKTVDADGDSYRTPPSEWTREQNEEATFNDKALNAIQSSLDTFEMELNEKGGHKKKGIALTVGTTSKSNSAYDEEEDEDLEEINEKNPDYALITRRLNTLIRASRGKQQKGGGEQRKPRNDSSGSLVLYERLNTPGKEPKIIKRAASDHFRPKEVKDFSTVQCYECKGYGHFANECPNTFRKLGKQVNFLSLSDSELDTSGIYVEEIPDDAPKEHAALTAVCVEENKSSHTEVEITSERYDESYYKTLFCFNTVITTADEEEEVSEEETLELLVKMQGLYKELYLKWSKQCKVVESLNEESTTQKASLAKLEVILTKKDAEIDNMTIQLNHANETFKRLNTGTSKLDEVLAQTQTANLVVGTSTAEEGDK